MVAAPQTLKPPPARMYVPSPRVTSGGMLTFTMASLLLWATAVVPSTPRVTVRISLAPLGAVALTYIRSLLLTRMTSPTEMAVPLAVIVVVELLTAPETFGAGEYVVVL